MTIENSLHDKHILLTRPEKDSAGFARKLQHFGAKVSFFPTITIMKNNLRKAARNSLSNIRHYDWVIFTSANGAHYFFEALTDLDVDCDVLRTKKIGAIGPETANMLTTYEVPVHFMPSQYLTKNIALEIDNIRDKKILLPRSNIAPPTLKHALERKGAVVTEVSIYKAVYLDENNPAFRNIVASKQLDYITFTSSSTVTGFLHRVTDIQLRKYAFAATVLSIGPVTTKTAREAGFSDIITAQQHTVDNIIQTLSARHAT